jgi:hypothetical protein
MKQNVPLLSQIIGSELSKNPMLQESIQLGFCNISGLAKYLKPLIEVQIGSKISTAALGMAIRRHCRSIDSGPLKKVIFPKHIDIGTSSGIYEVAVNNNDVARSVVEKIRKQIKISSFCPRDRNLA